MADRSILTPEVLRQLLRYDAETGELFWRPRGPEWFSDGKQTRLHAANKWNSRHAGTRAFNGRHLGYAIGPIMGVNLKAHRVIFSMVSGQAMSDFDEIDHINGDRLDNRACNLREASRGENCRNMARKKKSKTIHQGVYWKPQSRKWEVRCRFNGKQNYLGRYAMLCEAIRVRRFAEEKYGFHQNHGRASRILPE